MTADLRREAVAIYIAHHGDDARAREFADQVIDRSGAKVIRYRPQGSRPILLQEVVLTPAMSPDQRAACIRTLGGG